MCIDNTVCVLQHPDMWQEVTGSVAFDSREEWKRPDEHTKLQPAGQRDPAGETDGQEVSLCLNVYGNTR